MLMVYFLIPIILANLAIAVLSFLIYHRLQAKGKTSMAKLHLKPEKTVMDFKIFLVAHVYEAAVLLVVFGAAVVAKPILTNIGRFMSILYALMFAAVFLRWKKRF